MIKSITGGNGIQVDGGHFSLPYISQNSSNPLQGMLRVNNSDMQVYDGSSWITLGGSYTTVSLNGAAQSAILWAQQKMVEEAQLKELAKKHPAVADAVEKVTKTMDELKVIVALTEEGDKIGR